jgi:hypothetical protein
MYYDVLFLLDVYFSKQEQSYYQDIFISLNDDVNNHLQKIYKNPQEVKYVNVPAYPT